MTEETTEMFPNNPVTPPPTPAPTVPPTVPPVPPTLSQVPAPPTAMPQPGQPQLQAQPQQFAVTPGVKEPLRQKKSKLGLIAGIVSAVCIVLAIIAFVVVKQVTGLHAEDYATSLDLAKRLQKALSGDDANAVMQKAGSLVNGNVSIDDIRSTTTALNDLNKSLNSRITAMSNDRALNEDPGAKELALAVIEENKTYAADLAVLKEIAETTALIVGDINALTQAANGGQFDLAALNSLTNNATNVATKLSALDTENHEANLALDQAAVAYQALSDAVHLRLSNDPSANNAMIDAKNSLAQFESQWDSVVDKIQDHYDGYKKSVQELITYLQDQAQ